MSIYAGLDVSDKTTHICVVDVEGTFLPQRPLRWRSDSRPLFRWGARRVEWPVLE